MFNVFTRTVQNIAVFFTCNERNLIDFNAEKTILYYNKQEKREKLLFIETTAFAPYYDD